MFSSFSPYTLGMRRNMLLTSQQILLPEWQSALEIFQKHPLAQQLAQRLESNQPVSCTGLVGSSRILLALACRNQHSLPVVWLTPSSESAERLTQDLRTTLHEAKHVTHFPEQDESQEAILDPARLAILDQLDKQQQHNLIITSIRAMLQTTLSPDELKRGRFEIHVGESVDRDTVVEMLSAEGYSRTSMVERRAEFSLRGGILDVFPVTGDPVRIEFFGDDVESIRIFDRDSQRSLLQVPKVEILPAKETERQGKRLCDFLPRGTLVVLEEPSQLRLNAMEWTHEGWSGQWGDVLGLLAAFQPLYYSSWTNPSWDTIAKPEHTIEFQSQAQVGFSDRVEGLLKHLPKVKAPVLLVSLQASRLKELLTENNLQAQVVHGSLSEGFRLDDTLEVFSDKEITGAVRRRRPTEKAERGSLIRLQELEPHNLVVHLQHGIGRYLGVKSLVVQGNARDFLHLEYAKGDGVFVPVEQFDLVQRYNGIDSELARLSRVGSGEWTKARAKVKEDAERMAQELIKLYAERQMSRSNPFPADTPWQLEMEEAFPWTETEDQLRVISEVKDDMERPRPMDRLVCGDVGYGKTEVALRAAFKAAVEGRQVAVLVPTTVLAHQHYQSFCERLAAFPVKIQMLSRFRTAKEQKQTLADLKEGEVDIVVGTHRILSKDVVFKNLGMLVIDEEHRFGVRQKERIKEMKANVDVLAMTATPIPRTLNMALMGIRDMSVIETPPEDRVPIKTYLFESHPDIIKGAITREMAREGQVFFIHNRIEGIERLAADIRRLVPSARVAVGHGQMDEDGLEKLLMEFLNGEHDVLVSTTIIESGVDIPNVNTILINNAHHFGLAQLYQLRGRVGRSSRQGYCYLLYPPQRELQDEALKRLETIRDFTHLGAGYQIALKDLEIRGAGDILGREQSGSIAAVGFDLYCQMLNEAVLALRGEKPEKPVQEETPVVVEIPVPASLPEDYIADSAQKVALYKKIAAVRNFEDLEAVRDELVDRFGPPPPNGQYLLQLMEIRLRARAVEIPSVRVKEGKLHLLAPFLRKLTMKEKQHLWQETQWKCMEENMTMIFGSLFGVAAGPPTYPPAEEMLSKILLILRYLERCRTA
jgi:transcription-repair coupling factor (superfamily II helicase)